MACFALGLLGWSAVARADAPGSDLYARGVELRKQGRDADALELFRQANAATPSPGTRAQIGFAEQALGDWVKAEDDLAAALHERADPWVSRHVAALRAGLEETRKHLASVDLDARPAPGEALPDGAELWVNGASRAKLPLTTPLRTTAGPTVLEVRAGATVLFHEEMSVAPGAKVAQQIVLPPQPPASPPPPLPVSPPAEPGRDAVKERPSSPAVTWGPTAGPVLEPQRRSPRVPVAGWAFLTGAGALGAGAIVSQVVALNAAAVYNDDQRCFFGGLSRDQRCGAYRDRAESAQLVAVGLGAAAGVALARAAVLVFGSVSRSAEHAGAAEPVRCAPLVDRPGWACEGRF